MKTISQRYGKWGLLILMAVSIFLFFGVARPHLLSFHEQYQLFLWTGDYFLERISLPGGLADWLSELLVQFYYVAWLGALLLALLFIVLQRAVWRLLPDKWSLYPLSFLPPVLLFWLMGDESVLLSYGVALTASVAAAAFNGLQGRKGLFCDLALVPIIYWSFGPLAWVYVLLRLLSAGWKWMLPLPLWLLALQLIAYRLLPQWPLQSVLMGLNYYRIPMQWPPLMWIIPLATALLALVPKKTNTWLGLAYTAMLLLLGGLSLTEGYDSDRHELIRQDYLIRYERWDELVKRAKKKVVKTTFWSNSVNLALAQKRLLADCMFDYWQSGRDALIMPSKRDMMSNLPTAEAFWRLAMINSAQRFMADIQESILNGRKSGRCEQRIAECYIVNGKYALARKHLRLLKQSLFYRSWASEAEALLGDESAINSHPLYGRLRKLRFKEDFLYSYPEVDKVLGRLFIGNTDNKMALDYFIGQVLLNGDAPTFQQALPWAQQYGGYRTMPLGYQDVVNCIRQQGNVPGSPYAAFISRMIKMQNEQNPNEYETAH